jgi:N-acyl-D-amino-acid deacylase
MKGTLRTAMAVLLLAGCASAGGRTDTRDGAYDIVILNGRIVDGTGAAWFYGDIGIRGDRIARIAPRMPMSP